MISISCTSCKTLLTIDEAFAGGVCRCQHCGTIQTVPAGAKGHDSGMTGGSISGQSLGGSKANVPRQSTGTGLDDLADIVASSGLAGSGLSSRRLSRGAATGTATEAPVARKKPVIAIAAGAGVAVLGFVLFLALRGGDSGNNAGNSATAALSANDDGTSVAENVRGPSFAGAAIEGNTVIYVLDHGSGSIDVFELMKAATLRSIASLGTERKFQVIFWHRPGGEGDLMYPKTGPAYATPKRIDEARAEFDNIAAMGSTDAAPSVAQAYAQSPDAIVLATGKGPSLTDDLIAGIDAARKGDARIYAFSLGAGGSDVLKTVAERTKGQYKQVSASQLDALTR
jgi:hypothetical protein